MLLNFSKKNEIINNDITLRNQQLRDELLNLRIANNDSINAKESLLDISNGVVNNQRRDIRNICSSPEKSPTPKPIINNDNVLINKYLNSNDDLTKTNLNNNGKYFTYSPSSKINRHQQTPTITISN